MAFNGNLCPVTENEKSKVTIEHLRLIKECFWSKIKEDKNQLTLFDWRVFDFSIIPIELISGIYEDFLSIEEGAENQAKTGAFYTPRPLAEFDEPYTIKMKKPSRSEKHLEGLDQNEKALIKHMAKMIVNYVIRNA